MNRKIVFSCIVMVALIMLIVLDSATSGVLTELDKTHIVDINGERWDVTQAMTLGFKPEGFQYGIGRNAFLTLDDSDLRQENAALSEQTRIIGIAEGDRAHAYSVAKLSRHEIANTHIGETPITAAY